jgi:hypothetical protein
MSRSVITAGGLVTGSARMAVQRIPGLALVGVSVFVE